MRRFAPVLVVALLYPTGAASAATDPAAIAEGLRENPVYVDPEARPKLSRPEAGELRARIARRGPGRIKVAVVPESAAREAGGAGPLANAIDQRLRGRGTVIVAAGQSFHTVVSYPEVDRAIAALRSAVVSRREDGLAAQLLTAVDRIADVDPGPRGDGVAARDDRGGGAAPGEDEADEVLGAVKLGVLIVAAAIALPFLIVGAIVLIRYRRRRAEAAEELAEERRAADDELVALGDDIRALDLDVSMPSADARGRSEYEQALVHYERASRALARATTERRLARARAALMAARSDMEAAKVRLGSSGEAAGPPSGTADGPN